MKEELIHYLEKEMGKEGEHSSLVVFDMIKRREDQNP